MSLATENKIKVSHSPDSDDAFMFHAIANQKIDLQGLDFEIDSAEIQALNQLLFSAQEEGRNSSELLPDICAVSFHAYAHIADHYQILKPGASMGSGTHGPRLVAKPGTMKDLGALKVAVPGKLTSAYLCLRLYYSELGLDFEPVFCSFNEVFDLLGSGEVDASLLIHESQLKFEDQGFELLVDLGEWWHSYTAEKFGNGLAMPLGCNVIRRSLDEDLKLKISKLLHESIAYGLENFDETLDYSRKFSDNGLDDSKAKDYINMYVNQHTLGLSDEDLLSIKTMLYEGFEKGFIEADKLPSVDSI